MVKAMAAVTCPRCKGEKNVTVAVLYPNPPARILYVPCPFCKATGEVADEATAERLIADLVQTLEAAKAEIPWLQRKAGLRKLRELTGCTEFVITGVRW